MSDKNKVINLALIDEGVRNNQIQQWLRDEKFKSIASTLCDVQPMSEGLITNIWPKPDKEELENETR
jgi:hypothetical protein